MKRVIFDLDGTLLYGNFDNEDILFKASLGEEADSFIKKKMEYINEYERTYLAYERKLLSHFLSEKANINFNIGLVNAWIELNSKMEDNIDTDAFKVLEYLKKKGYDLSILTNWFADTQIARLKRSNLFSYFDTIICGDRCLKPNMESYLLASGENQLSDCVIVGDTLLKDVLVPIQYGMTGIHYAKETNVEEQKHQKIKKLDELMEIY